MEYKNSQGRGGARNFSRVPHWGLPNRKMPYVMLLVGVLGVAGLIVSGAFSSTMDPGEDSPNFPRWTDGKSALNRHLGPTGKRGPLLSYSFQPWGGMEYELPARILSTGPQSNSSVPVPKARDCIKWYPGTAEGYEDILAKTYMKPLAGRNL